MPDSGLDYVRTPTVITPLWCQRFAHIQYHQLHYNYMTNTNHITRITSVHISKPIKIPKLAYTNYIHFRRACCPYSPKSYISADMKSQVMHMFHNGVPCLRSNGQNCLWFPHFRSLLVRRPQSSQRGSHKSPKLHECSQHVPKGTPRALLGRMHHN